jgi:hypothetical protein
MSTNIAQRRRMRKVWRRSVGRLIGQLSKDPINRGRRLSSLAGARCDKSEAITGFSMGDAGIVPLLSWQHAADI